MEYLKKILAVIMTRKIFGTFMVIVITYLLIKWSNHIISKMLVQGKKSYEVKRRTTIVKLVKSIFNAFLIIIAALIILDFFGINTKSLVASVGIISAVIGLALQDTMKDFIGGVSLILDNYLAVGDIVTFDDFTGEVIELGLRVTKIKKFSGEVMIVANRHINTIINESQKRADIFLEIDTAYEEDSKKVIKVLEDVLKNAIKDKLIFPESKYLGINELSSSSVKYMLDIHCDQNNKYNIKREMLSRIKLAYDKNNIKIPYTQIEVHNGKEI